MDSSAVDPKFIGLASFISVSLLSYLWKRTQCKTVTIKELYIYPIKSCKGIKVTEAKIARRGFQHDRLLMVVDSNGNFTSQRKDQKLALVDTAITTDEKGRDILTISAENMRSVSFPLFEELSGPILEVTVWGEKCEAYEILEGSYWFREYLDKEGLKLVKMKDEFIRFTDPEFAPDGETSFADGFPFLVASQASLDYINSMISKKISMRNFRPNIVVDGCSAYAEDNWKSFTVKDSKAGQTVEMKVVKPCSRCTMPHLDPDTSKPYESDELKIALKSHRTGKALGYPEPSWQKQLFFGQNLVHDSRSSGVVRVGDIVVVK